MKRDILNIYQSAEEAYPQINTKSLKAEICENIKGQGLISTIRPEYIDRYQTEVNKNDCNFESGDSEESFQIHGNQTMPSLKTMFGKLLLSLIMIILLVLTIIREYSYSTAFTTTKLFIRLQLMLDHEKSGWTTKKSNNISSVINGYLTS